MVSAAVSTRTGMGFRCGGAWGRGALARVASVGLRLYLWATSCLHPWASGCLRWPAEREMGIYVGRPKFGVKLSSLPVLKATLGTGKGGFGSRVDSHWHGVSVWRSLGPWGLGTRGVLRLSTLAGWKRHGCWRWPAWVRRKAFFFSGSESNVITGKGGFGSRVDSHWHAWASGCIRGPPAVYVGRLKEKWVFTLAGLSSA